MLLSSHRCNSYSLFLTILDPPRLTGSQGTARCSRAILVSLKIPPTTKKSKKSEAQRSDSAWPREQESQQQEGCSWPRALHGPAESTINSAGTKPLPGHTQTHLYGLSAPFVLVLKWSCVSRRRRASRDGLIDGSWPVNG